MDLPYAEGVLEQSLQPIQCQVRQRRRDDSALRCTCLRRKQRSIFHVARLQPFLQHLFIRGDVVEHPSVADVVEAATDVTLKNPPCVFLFGTAHGSTARWHRRLSVPVENHRSWDRQSSPRPGAARAGRAPASSDPSSWGFPAVSACHWPSGYRHVAAVAADSRTAAVYRWPCIWTPEYSRSLRPLPACSCPDCASLALPPTLGRRTSGSAAIARLSPCRDGLPVLP